MSQKVWSPKDPDEIRDRGFNWTPRNVGNATITGITCAVILGPLTVVSSRVEQVLSSAPGQGTVHRFSGGVAGTTCELLLTATFSNGEVLQQTVYLPIRNI